MNIKRNALIFTSALLMLALTACGGESDNSLPESGTASTTQSSVSSKAENENTDPASDTASDNTAGNSTASADENTSEPESSTESSLSQSDDESSLTDEISQESSAQASAPSVQTVSFIDESDHSSVTGEWSAAFFSDEAGTLYTGKEFMGDSYAGMYVAFEDNGNYTVYISYGDQILSNNGTYDDSDASKIHISYQSDGQTVEQDLVRGLVSTSDSSVYQSALRMPVIAQEQVCYVYLTPVTTAGNSETLAYETVEEFSTSEGEDDLSGAWKSLYFTDLDGNLLSGTELFGSEYTKSGGWLTINDDMSVSIVIGVTRDADCTTGTIGVSGSSVTILLDNGESLPASKVLINGTTESIAVAKGDFVIFFVR